jgi:hypothetical protein
VTVDRYNLEDGDELHRLLDEKLPGTEIRRLPDNMKVEADEDTGINEKTVGELRARTVWPRGLVVIIPRELYPEAVVKISKSE